MRLRDSAAHTVPESRGETQSRAGDLHRSPAHFGLFRLGQGECEYAVLEMSADALLIHRLRQFELSEERIEPVFAI